MEEFKIGDEVKVVSGYRKGATGTIESEKDHDGEYEIDFDSGNWGYVSANRLEKIDDEDSQSEGIPVDIITAYKAGFIELTDKGSRTLEKIAFNEIEESFIEQAEKEVEMDEEVPF